MKYYWILVKFYTGKVSNYDPDVNVTSTHPFEFIKTINKSLPLGQEYILLNWKEITKKEYELWT